MPGLKTTCVPVILLDGNLVFTDGCQIVPTEGGSNITHKIMIDRPGRDPVEVAWLLNYKLLDNFQVILEQFVEEISLAHHEGRTADLRTIELIPTKDIRLRTNYF